MRTSCPASRTTLSERQYILGRREKTMGGVLNIGRYYALDSSLGAPVYIDVLHPHMIFICGKRGYGKSFTIGVLLEEIATLDQTIRQNLGVMILDTLGIYWTTQFPSSETSEKLAAWGRKPMGFPIRVLTPTSNLKDYSLQGVTMERFTLCIAEVSPLHWCRLFNIHPTDAVGIVLTRAVLMVHSSMDRFCFDDILRYVQSDVRSKDEVKAAVENFFIMADSWDVFDKDGLSLEEIIRPGTLTILDLSVLKSQVLKDIVVAIISEKIFEQRIVSRKTCEQRKIGFTDNQATIPLVWLAIDEAQLFVPSGKETLSKEVLIEEWMRQGRQPGLSLILATQRPSAIEPEVLSHCDIIISHRLTAQEDVDALSRIRPLYMHGDISESLKKIGTEKGVAVLIDDTSETVHLIKVRPRVSWHGGAEPVITDGGSV
jgi:hypothetical protein